MKENNWIPVSSGVLPEEYVDVQVTYIGYEDHIPYCDEFAYISKGKWYWSSDCTESKVQITAWKPNCEPYKGD